MATCGPTNAMQSMKSYVARDASLQRERVAGLDPSRPRAFGPQGPANVEAQFNSFSAHGPSSFGNEFAQAPPLAQPAYRDHALGAGPKHEARGSPRPADVGYMSLTPEPQNLGPRHANGDWAKEFQNLSISDAAHESPRYQSPPNAFAVPHYAQQSGAFGQFGQFGPQLGPFNHFAFQPTAGLQTEGQRGQAGADAFADAFAEAEASLKSLQAVETPQHVEPEEQQPRDKPENVADASTVAANIIHTISERKDEELAKKVQGSKFMTLMSKMKSNEVKIDSKDLVDTTDNSVIDTTALEADPEALAAELASASDWAPQRPVNSILANAREQPPLVQEEKPRRYRFSKDLDDPDTYLLKLRKNLDPRLFDKSPYESPFGAAEDLAPQALSSGSWEEHYESW